MYIFGLGNPGKEYELTRHNAGRIIFSYLKKEYDLPDWKEDIKIKTLKSKGEINGEKVELFMPNNFMNNSGTTVTPIIDTPKKLTKLIVIYDDLDLPIGTLKISFNKSSGGHNGLESVIKKVKSKEFVRIRIGIMPVTPTGKYRKPKGEEAVMKFLLSSFKEDELKTLKKLSKKIAEIITMISKEGKDKAMSVYN